MGPKKRSSIERSLDRSTSRRNAPASSARISRTGTHAPSLKTRIPLTGTPTSILSMLFRYMHFAHKTIVPRPGGGRMPGVVLLVKALTVRRFGAAFLRGFRLDHLQELILLNFEVFRELLWGHAA